MNAETEIMEPPLELEAGPLQESKREIKKRFSWPEKVKTRQREKELNPYLLARRTWNGQSAENVSSRQTWQIIGVLSMMIALTAVGGVIKIGSQSKLVPYIIEVDELGETLVVGLASKAGKADARVVHASVASFISDVRLVTSDAALQTKAIHRAYSKLSSKDPALNKTNVWLNATEESRPFRRAEKLTVSIEVKSVIPQTPETWQVDWLETETDRQGGVIGIPFRMRAIVTTYTTSPTEKTTEEDIRNNPLGVFIRDYSWAKQI